MRRRMNHGTKCVAESATLALVLATSLMSLTRPRPGSAAAPEPGQASVTDDGAEAAARRAADSCNQFGIDLYARVTAGDAGHAADASEAREQGNLLLSPYGVETALAMTCGGAKGETAEQMARVLHLDPTTPPDRAQAAFGSLYRRLDERADTGIEGLRAFDLVCANALWVQRGLPINGSFRDLLKRQYGAELESLDFAGGALSLEDSRRAINGWVAKQTRDKISDLLAPGSLGSETRLVLADAIYFKGRWENLFNKDWTRDEVFHAAPLAPGTGRGGKRDGSRDGSVESRVPTMHQTNQFLYAEDERVQVVELPYTFGRLSMVVLLPKKVDGLADLEKSLSAKQLDRWREAAAEREVELSLPRFKFDSRFALAPVLRAMGMGDALEAKADFTGITPARPLWIQDVVHQTFVAVDEEGTEAAAATAVGLAAAAPPAPKPKAVFRADHPFLFAIRDNASDALLFLGRVADPSASPTTHSPTNSLATPSATPRGR